MGSSRKYGLVAWMPRASAIASAGSSRAWTSKQISTSGPTAARSASMTGDRLANDDRGLVAIALLGCAPADEPPALLDGGEPALYEPVELMPPDVAVGRNLVSNKPAE